MVESGLCKSKEEAARQEEVLRALDKIVKEWVKQLARQRGHCDERANALLFTYGSYHLGVDVPGADIDTLCVGPKYVNREKDFFAILHDILAQMEEVTELQPIPNAHIPAMKFKLHGIAINLLYASVSLTVVPSDLDISQRSVLSGVDEVNLRSLNECRVADQILDLVPNIENFQTTLRCFQYWAKRSGVCSNAAGFLREVDCALLVARVCQVYPNAAPSTLVTRLFSIFAEWYWPNPVMLCFMDQDRELGFPVWDSRRNRDDWNHVMPIITPAYPCRNSTVHVVASTLEVMKEQFRIGNGICQEIEMKRASWADLF